MEVAACVKEVNFSWECDYGKRCAANYVRTRKSWSEGCCCGVGYVGEDCVEVMLLSY